MAGTLLGGVRPRAPSGDGARGTRTVRPAPGATVFGVGRRFPSRHSGAGPITPKRVVFFTRPRQRGTGVGRPASAGRAGRFWRDLADGFVRQVEPGSVRRIETRRSGQGRG